MKTRNLAMVGLLGTALLTGNSCSHKEQEFMAPGMTGILKPEVSLFLTGPFATALTNPKGGYSARVSFLGGASTPSVSGQLLVQGSKLFFAPDPGTVENKLQRLAGFSYIWDASEAKGYVLSEGLQGYAALTFAAKPTNTTTQAASTPAEKVGGYQCEAQQVHVQMSDGTESVLQVLWAVAPKGLPVRVSSSDNPPMVLSLSRLRPETFKADLFEPPPDFTRYENATVMADELVLRQRNIRQGKGPAITPMEQ